MNDELNYNEDLEIDPFNLHEEWLRQTILEDEYGKLLVEAKRDLSQAGERIKIVRSELIKKCKSKYAKPTTQDVESYYRRNKKHKRAKEKYIKAEYEYGMVQNAVWRLMTKKDALKEIIKLYLNQYYSDPDGKEFEQKLNEWSRKKLARNKIKKAKNKSKKKSKRTK